MNNKRKRLERLQQLFDEGTSLGNLIKIYILEYGFLESEVIEQLRRDINALSGTKSDERTAGDSSGESGREAYRILSEL